eukprot:CCRYP_013351-RB/>CCRYP_013351-RB protein AED:0.14 eAED:0.14 QI:201/0.5/0.66/1/0/0/3/67/41
MKFFMVIILSTVSFSSWSSLGLKFWHLCPFVGYELGGPLNM